MCSVGEAPGTCLGTPALSFTVCWWAVVDQAPPSPRQQCQVSLCVFLVLWRILPLDTHNRPQSGWACCMCVWCQCHRRLLLMGQSTQPVTPHLSPTHTRTAILSKASGRTHGKWIFVQHLAILADSRQVMCLCVCVFWGCIWIVMNWQYELKVHVCGYFTYLLPLKLKFVIFCY